MIASVVLCPHPPLLFRELGGIADPVADLRTACLEALGSALSAGPSVVVVVAAVEAGEVVDASRDPDVRRFGGLDAATRPGLPLPLGVGRRLLDEVGWVGRTELVGIDLDADTATLEALATELTSRPGDLVVLLLGDGSARRDQKGPGTLDERAFPFDATVVEAVRNGDVEALAGLDADLAEELLVLGRAAFRLLGEIGRQAPPAATQLLHEDDPFGVLYLVAAWTWRDS